MKVSSILELQRAFILAQSLSCSYVSRDIVLYMKDCTTVFSLNDYQMMYHMRPSELAQVD